MEEKIPGLVQLVSSGAVELAARGDVEDIDDSCWYVKNYCENCRAQSLEPMFHKTKACDGSFPEESQVALKKLVDKERALGWRHTRDFFGMILQCPDCLLKEKP